MEKTEIIKFPKLIDRRGNLSFAEVQQHILFDIARVYRISDPVE